MGLVNEMQQGRRWWLRFFGCVQFISSHSVDRCTGFPKVGIGMTVNNGGLSVTFVMQNKYLELGTGHATRESLLNESQ